MNHVSAGEFTESREGKLLLLNPKTGRTRTSEGDGGMQMASKAGVFCPRFMTTRPRCQAPRFRMTVDSQFGPRIAGVQVVVAAHQIDHQFGMPFSPRDQRALKFRRSPPTGMQKITQHHQPFAVRVGDQFRKPGATLRTAITGHSNSYRPKGGRFPEMRIGDKQRVAGRPMNGPVGKQFQPLTMPIDFQT